MHTRSHFMLGLCAASGAAGLLAHAGPASAIASDIATDPVYADGWQAGDNGGSGFTPWNFDGTYASPIQQGMDDTSPFNQLGRSWTLFNPLSNDVARAGRGFAPLVPGQTLTTLIDNPNQRNFFRGYQIRFNSGGANVCYGNVSCTDNITPVPIRFRVLTFEYFTDGA